MTYYATLADARREARAVATTDDDQLLGYLRTVSQRVDRALGHNYFEPHIRQQYYGLTADRIDSARRLFTFPDPLLVLSAVQANGAALTLTTEVEVWPPVGVPVYQLRLVSTAGYWQTVNCPVDWPDVRITGTWGMHPAYSEAWYNADALAGAINASVTSLTVADVDGAGRDGETPRISAGNLLRIDSEFLRVTATNTTANTATVQRGVNGSTKASHDPAATVEVYYPPDDIRQVVARQAALLYSRRGSFEQTQIFGAGVTTYPPDLLPELVNAMQRYSHYGPVPA